DCEARAEEALRRAVPTPSRMKRVRHRRMSTETEAWFAYLENDRDADPIEYVHRIEEAKRYGIPVSRPAAPERKKKNSKPTTPVANKQNATERHMFPCYSMDKVMEPLSTLS
ncbi:hypothetical protein G6514_001886, partial [Epicoccum nigrum]